MAVCAVGLSTLRCKLVGLLLCSMSRTCVQQAPSFYDVVVDGESVSVVLVTREEAESLSCWDHIESTTGTQIT